MKPAEVTRTLERRGEKALVAFFTAGYPDDHTFVELVIGAAQAGCDVVEIGIPFSDPIADGPVIQASSEAALRGGMTLSRALELSREISVRTDTPLVAMSYFNPVLNMGVERFTVTAAESGIGGVILPDVPLEESADTRRAVLAKGVDYIDLVAPTTGSDRLRRIVAATSESANDGNNGSAFLYLVSVTGVTGDRTAVLGDIEIYVNRVRDVTELDAAGLPLYVGFGVSSARQAYEVSRYADGVIIGSQLIRLIDEAQNDSDQSPVQRVTEFLAEVKRVITQ